MTGCAFVSFSSPKTSSLRKAASTLWFLNSNPGSLIPATRRTTVPKIDQTIDNVTSGYGIAPIIGTDSTCIESAANTGEKGNKGHY